MLDLEEQLFSSRLHEDQVVYFLSDCLEQNDSNVSGHRSIKTGYIIGPGSSEQPYHRPLVVPYNTSDNAPDYHVTLSGVSSRSLFTEDEVRTIAMVALGDAIDTQTNIDAMIGDDSSRELVEALGSIMARRYSSLNCYNEGSFET